MFLQANIKDFKYYVRQRIGVYCKDADWMEMAFQTILKCYFIKFSTQMKDIFIILFSVFYS